MKPLPISNTSSTKFSKGNKVYYNTVKAGYLIGEIKEIGDKEIKYLRGYENEEQTYLMETADGLMVIKMFECDLIKCTD